MPTYEFRSSPNKKKKTKKRTTAADLIKAHRASGSTDVRDLRDRAERSRRKDRPKKRSNAADLIKAHRKSGSKDIRDLRDRAERSQTKEEISSRKRTNVKTDPSNFVTLPETVDKQTVTRAQFDKIRAGTLKVNADLLQAVKSGNVNITEESFIDKVQRNFGIGGLGAEHYLAAFGLSVFGSSAAAGPAAVRGVNAAALANRVPIGAGGGFVADAVVKSSSLNYAQQIGAAFNKHPFVTTALGIAIYTIIKEGQSGKVLGKFVGQEEAAQMVSMPKWLGYEQAIESGDWTVFDEARAIEDALYADQAMWDEVVSNIPWANALVGLEKFRRTGIATAALWDQLKSDAITQRENGESDEEKWSRINDQRAEREREIIDYYNEERRELVEWETQADAAARNAERDEERKAYKAEAAFWAKENEKKSKQEQEDREAEAEFWLNYRKELIKMQEATRPSNLQFGLL